MSDLGRAHHRRRRRSMFGASSKTDSRGCKVIEFTRDSKGRRYSAPVVVERCAGKKLRAHNRRQCRNRKKQFIKCPGAPKRRRGRR